MGLFDKFFGKKPVDAEIKLPEPPEYPPMPEATKPRKPRKSKEVVIAPAIPATSAKEAATLRGDPWVGVISVELDAENVGNGAFELDWNDKFLAQLVRAGFQRKPNEPESVIIDRWFQEVCRNVIMENFEQFEANLPRDPRGIQRKDLGDGRAEIG